MRIAVLGAGAMGSVFGGKLALAGNDVTLIDVRREAVEAIQTRGLRIEDWSGNAQTIRLGAVTNPAAVGPVDLVLVFVKCYDTDAAAHSALPMLGADTAVLSLQNGWGNAPKIAEIVGEERVLAGITYHSATVLGPGQVHYSGRGATIMGELDGRISERLTEIAGVFTAAGIDVTPTATVLKEIWAKLATVVCTLPTSALLRFYAGQLIEHEGTMQLMRALLREAVEVANSQGFGLDYQERWESITELLKHRASGKPSMLQDVEQRRRTEIDVVNGAIVAAGRRLNIPTPHNEAMVWLIKSLEETFQAA